MPSSNGASLTKQLTRIKMILIDVDGVLAKPQIIWAGQADGKRLYEIKEFCVHDGAATWAAKQAGLIQVVISGRDSLAVRKRIERMQVNELWVGNLNKLKALEILKKNTGSATGRLRTSATIFWICRLWSRSVCRSRSGMRRRRSSGSPATSP